jgi:hypothetical protein
MRRPTRQGGGGGARSGALASVGRAPSIPGPELALARRAPPPGAFRSWLVDQAARPDPVGDLARYLYADLPPCRAGSSPRRGS